MPEKTGEQLLNEYMIARNRMGEVSGEEWDAEWEKAVDAERRLRALLAAHEAEHQAVEAYSKERLITNAYREWMKLIATHAAVKAAKDTP